MTDNPGSSRRNRPDGAGDFDAKIGQVADTLRAMADRVNKCGATRLPATTQAAQIVSVVINGLNVLDLGGLVEAAQAVRNGG